MIPSSDEKRKLYQLSLKQVKEALADETDITALLASVVCILKTNLPHGFWIGFYRVDTKNPRQLVVGPYQGTFGCLRIDFGAGVCGTCAERREAVIVADVHQFPGHIACDAASASEIVLPLFDQTGSLYAVLDLDAVKLGAFDEVDQHGLEAILEIIRKKL
ncbi:GAF domain-containing protein [bacterium]|nr:GAF domain-containing protein [bacterium]MBU1651042.1 GAF domain-containing protein [bacterium]MBU1881170.1 GAF domain-containing protein [bacterium]